MIVLTGKITFPEELNIEPIVLNKRNLTNIDYSIFDRGEVERPNWGIISNVGNITVIDSNEVIKQLSKQKLLKGLINVEFFLANTLVKNCIMSVGKFYAQKWNYDTDNKICDIEIGDELVNWQNTQIEPMKIEFDRNDASIYYLTAYEVLMNISETANINLQIDEQTELHLKSINIPIPNYSGNLWSVLQDFAIAFQLRIYKNYLGQIVCNYNGDN